MAGELLGVGYRDRYDGGGMEKDLGGSLGRNGFTKGNQLFRHIGQEKQEDP